MKTLKKKSKQRWLKVLFVMPLFLGSSALTTPSLGKYWWKRAMGSGRARHWRIRGTTMTRSRRSIWQGYWRFPSKKLMDQQTTCTTLRSARGIAKCWPGMCLSVKCARNSEKAVGLQHVKVEIDAFWHISQQVKLISWLWFNHTLDFIIHNNYTFAWPLLVRQCPKPGCIAVFKSEEEMAQHTVCKYLQIEGLPENYLQGEDRIKKQGWESRVLSF